MPLDFRPVQVLHVLPLYLMCLLIEGISSGAPIEICETESFKASCPQGKVVVMTNARYGRMRIGRCVKKSLGYLGCFADVLSQADRRCSGMQDCEIRMPDPEFDRTAPCLEELKTYFEASFQCREVLQPPKPCSLGGDRWIISGLEHGSISNTVTMDTNCGTEQLPLEIRAFPGQRINITLYDFNTPYKTHQTMQYDDVTHVRCDEFITILDNHSKSKRKLCPGTHRVSHGYTSTNDSLLVFFKKIPSAQESKKFLLDFQVIGCRDVVPPEGMYFTRTADDAEIGCRRTSEVWSLACVQGKWKGEVGNCSSSVTVGIILSLALVIGMVVLILGIIFLKRLNRPKLSRNNSHIFNLIHRLQKGACADDMDDSGTGAVEMKRVHDQELHVCSHNFNLIAANPLEENLTKLHEDTLSSKDNPSNDYAPIKFHTFKASMLKQEDCREGLLAHDHVCPNKTVYFHPQVQDKPAMQYAYHAAPSPRLVGHRFKEGETVVHTCGKDRETSLYDRARFCSHDKNEMSSATLPRKPSSFSMNNSF